MSLLMKRREFIVAYRKTGSIEAAAAKLGVDPAIHDEWMKDWLYSGAFAEVKAEMKREAAGKPPLPPPVAKRKPGRPRKERPPVDPTPKRMGRPPRNPPPVPPPSLPSGSPDEPVPVSAPADVPLPPVPEMGTVPIPPVPKPESPSTTENSTVCTENSPTCTENSAAPLPEGVIEPSKRGYTRLYVKEEELPAVQEPEPPPKPLPEPEAPLEITVSSDAEQRALIDEYGELDRRMQLRATDTARYESLKRAIKSWFCNVPADADGTVEGNVYLLHLSACERERKIRSLRELVDVIGLDKVLDLAVVPIGQLEQLMGKAHVEALTIMTRSGSRRIKAIPKRPAAVQ